MELASVYQLTFKKENFSNPLKSKVKANLMFKFYLKFLAILRKIIRHINGDFAYQKFRQKSLRNIENSKEMTNCNSKTHKKNFLKNRLKKLTKTRCC